MSFEAQYTGRCVICGEPINIGELIAYDADGDTVHEVCPVSIAGVREICSNCHTEKSVSGACECSAAPGPSLCVIGIDPGPIPGIVVLDYADGAIANIAVAQCSHQVAPAFYAAIAADIPAGTKVLVALERFVVSRRSGRSSTASAGEITRELIGRIVQATDFAVVPPSAFLQRSAGEVKPWATDVRLEAAGLIEACKGMRHARDAARHALFAAVHDGGVPDPLSKKAASPVKTEGDLA